MTAIREPDPPADETDQTIGQNVQFTEGSGELRIDNEMLVAPEFIASEYGYTRLKYARYSPSIESGAESATVIYGETRRVRLVFSDRHIVIVDVEFDEERDGQMWQRALREEYDDFETAFERYTEVLKNGLVDVSLMDIESPPRS